MTHQAEQPFSTTLTSLPAEILFGITSHLDPRSSVQLSQACHTLQQPAESRVWHRIRLTHCNTIGNSFAPPDTELPEADAQREAELRRTHVGAWSLSSQKLVKHLTRVLDSAPWRRTYVRELDLELQHAVPLEVVSLVRSLGNVLEDLRILLPTMLPGLVTPSELPGFTSVVGVFMSLPGQLTALKRVRISIQSDWHDTIFAILRVAPNLEVLHIENHLLSTKTFKPYNPDIDRLPLIPSLKTLITQESHTCFGPTLTAIVESAPNLETVALRDPALLWRPDEEDALLRALGAHERLKTLEVTSNCFDSLCEPGGFQAVEELSVMWGVAAMKAREQQGYIIPPLPSLQQYHFEISIYSTGVSGHPIGHLIQPHIAAMQLLTSVGIPQLAHAPSLRIIHCPTYLDFSRHDVACSRKMVLPGWEHPTFQGMVVRGYEGKGGELLHVRSRMDPEGAGCDKATDAGGWEETGLWNGKSVPVGVLAGVLSAAGIKVGDDRGRMAEMSEKGWDVLRRWEVQSESWG
ncbi:hypothetical protein IAT38_001879 [Cryptococcus sp. DSM 104549]